MNDLQAPGRLVIVRHGATEWSELGRHTGRTDLPLIAKGRQRARELAPALAGEQFDRVLASPLLRARATCELAGFGDRAERCDDLREWDYGDYEGLTRAEILERAPGWNLWRDGCPGGERPAQVGARADSVLAALRSRSATSVLAFAHGHILRVLGARWTGMQVEDGARLVLSPASISVLAHEHQTPVIERWNSRSR